MAMRLLFAAVLVASTALADPAPSCGLPGSDACKAGDHILLQTTASASVHRNRAGDRAHARAALLEEAVEATPEQPVKAISAGIKKDRKSKLSLREDRDAWLGGKGMSRGRGRRGKPKGNAKPPKGSGLRDKGKNSRIPADNAQGYPIGSDMRDIPAALRGKPNEKTAIGSPIGALAKVRKDINRASLQAREDIAEASDEAKKQIVKANEDSAKAREKLRQLEVRAEERQKNQELEEQTLVKDALEMIKKADSNGDGVASKEELDQTAKKFEAKTVELQAEVAAAERAEAMAAEEKTKEIEAKTNSDPWMNKAQEKKEGAYVWAKYEKRWYRARIVEVLGGDKYKIDWADGDTEDRIKLEDEICTAGESGCGWEADEWGCMEDPDYYYSEGSGRVELC